MNLEQEIRMLKEQVRSLSQRIEQRPVVQTVKPPTQQYLIIESGNTLASGQVGIKHLTTVISSVPSAYDPNVTSAFIDGIGRAKLIKDAVIQDGYVLVCNDARSAWRCAFRQGDAVAVSGSVNISYGAGTVAAFVPV
jgi:hypothetical protein